MTKFVKKLAIALLLLPLVAPAAAGLDKQTLSPTDRARVQRQCTALLFREGGSLISNSEEPVGIVVDPSSQWAANANAMDSALSRVDLDRLSVEDCRRAGFYRQGR